MASTRASRVRTLTEKPRTSMTAKVPMRETGMAMDEIRVVTAERRKTRFTTTTRPKTTPSVNHTSAREARTKIVLSTATRRSTPAGRAAPDGRQAAPHRIRDCKLVGA